ncbi:MAG TPA: alpha/beta hydrolase [Puia sp.]|nr:alpha/beta hydrolase [Puia sp.]
MIAKIGRISLRVFVGVLLFLILVTLIFDRLVQFRMDDHELISWFHHRHLDPKISYYQADGRKVRYLEVGNQPNATILFIHGAPSSLSYWKAYMADSFLLARATMFAADRPGYGYSGLADPLPDIAVQAAIQKEILDSLHKAHHPVILVGVSYGAPIAARLTMDYPGLVDGLVLMAPPLGPGREKIFWFTHLVENPLIHWVVPRMLQSANREKIHHKDELTKMLPLWGRIHVPVIYLQGQEDGLVDTSNATFAREHLINAPSLDIQMLPGRGHLIAFAEKNRVEKAILTMLDKVGARQ